MKEENEEEKNSFVEHKLAVGFPFNAYLLLQDIIINMSDWIWAVDENGRYTYSSQKGSDWLGVSSGDIIGKTPFDFMPSDEAVKIKVIFSEIAAKKTRIKDLENWNINHKNGQRFCLLTNGVPLLDEGGNLKGYFGIDQDITERKQAEKELRRWKNIFEHIDFGVVVNNGELLGEMNSAFADMHGYKKEELIGHSIAEVFAPDFRAELSRHIQIAHEKQHYEFESVHVRKDGSTFPVLVAVNVVRGSCDEVLYRIAAVQDITGRKKTEEEKVKLESQFQQSQKMESVGRLAGGVAHDFNNMLGVILGHADLVLSELSPTSVLRESVEEILKAAKRSAELTRQLLAFARKQTIVPKVLNLNEIVEGVLKMLQRLIGEDIHLRWQPDSYLWSVMVDPSQIDQILVNLCVNARDAIDDIGTVTIETGNCTFNESDCITHIGFLPGEYARLSVSDTGCGIDEETSFHLFEPFFTTKAIGQGTGLGLSTVYGIAKQNNGFISVFSKLGQGSRFTVYLPRYAGKAVAQTHDMEGIKMPMCGQEIILLVEDEPSILKLTKMMLEKYGYKVLAANTPGQALYIAREWSGDINLLITDVVMPEMNGRDLAKNLISLYPNIKRLFMSGYTADIIAHHGVVDEGVYFIQKPFSTKELLDKVRGVLS